MDLRPLVRRSIMDITLMNAINFFVLNPMYLVTVLIAAVDIFIGFFVYLKNPKLLIHRSFLFFTWSVTVWITGVLILFESQPGGALVLFGSKLAFAGAVIVVALFLHFAVIFPFRLNFVRSSWIFAVYFLAAVLVFLSLATDTIVKGIAVVSGDYRSFYGFAHPFFGLYFVAGMISALCLIFYKYYHSPLELKPQVRFFLIGALIAFLGAVTTNLFIPMFSGSSFYSRYGPLALTPFVIFTAYAIVKHKMLNIKVIAAEFFSVVLVFVLFVRLLFSRTPSDFVFGIIFLAAASIFTFLLIRAVYREVHDRERIADLAEELKISNEKLKKLDQAKSEFISMASHQLRAPLTLIRGYLDMIREGTFGEVLPKM